MRPKISRLMTRGYTWLCGRELSANLLHFQFLPSHYFRRHLRQDAGELQGRLLDVGCGNQPYRPHLPRVTFYIGLDYPTTQALQDFHTRPEVYGDARRLPFADGSFDAILCAQVLEHVNQPAAVLREISRVLKPGGAGILSVPFIYNVHVGPYDFFRFSPYGLQELLQQAGLRLKILRYQGGVGTAVVQLLHNWVFSGLARLSRRGAWGALLGGLALPFLLIWCALNNLAALAVDRLDIDTPRFSPNLWVVFQKEDRSATVSQAEALPETA